ncbi:MAG: RNA polymerase sigma factor [Candidatus Glassbacteria bacterium]|nr:RNA polymerase sigma factor [Candidatus Glassbacteria bacterium]
MKSQREGRDLYQMSDEQLILAIERGERDKFGLLVESYQRRIYRFLRNMGLDHDEAADITQNTFILAYKNLGSIQRNKCFRSWLFTIAANQARNYFRKRSRQRQVPLDDLGPLAVDENQSLPVERGQLRERLEALLDRLPLKQRQVVVMRVFEQLPFDEVALACGLGLSNAKVTYHRAMKKLAGWLGPSLSEIS